MRHVSSISSEVRISADGSYRFYFYGEEGKSSFMAVWDAGNERSGIVSLSFDGNYGDSPATLNFSTNINAYKSSQTLKFIDIDVSGLPAGGAFMLYCYP